MLLLFIHPIFIQYHSRKSEPRIFMLFKQTSTTIMSLKVISFMAFNLEGGHCPLNMAMNVTAQLVEHKQ